jgi:nicotinate-nucleotide adenylyltransferase
MQKISRYGILGGTFDPPHIGHLALAQEAFAQLGLDRVWFLPTGDPPHKQGRQITPASDRLAMTHLAVDPDERFAVSDIELRLPTPSYTLATLAALRAEWGAVELTLIMGWDMLLYLPHWHDPVGVVAATDRIAAGHRPGYRAEDAALRDVEAAVYGLHSKLNVLGGPQLDLSATEIRARLASDLPVRYLVPDAVRSYIDEHQLYAVEHSRQSPG